MGHCCDRINTAPRLISTQRHSGQSKRAGKWTNRIMFGLLWEGFVFYFWARNCISGTSAVRCRGWKKQKTIHYLVQTPVVHIVHSAVIQRQKCAVNAGKQRNWGVTYNERHLRGGTVASGDGGGGGGGWWRLGTDSAALPITLQQLWRKWEKTSFMNCKNSAAVFGDLGQHEKLKMNS